MYSVAYEPDEKSIRETASDPRSQEIAKILEMHARVVESRDLMYCSPPIRALIEEDIPLLISYLRAQR